MMKRRVPEGSSMMPPRRLQPPWRLFFFFIQGGFIKYIRKMDKSEIELNGMVFLTFAEA